MGSANRRLNDPGIQVLFIPGRSNPDDWHGNRTGTYNGSYAEGPYGGHTVFDLDGTDDKDVIGDVGSVRTISFNVKPDTTTEEFVKLSSGNDIMVSGGTITYTGVSADQTYVDGEISTTLVAGKWQHVVCVLSAAHAADSFDVGWDGTNYGASEMGMIRAHNVAMTGDEAKALWREARVR